MASMASLIPTADMDVDYKLELVQELRDKLQIYPRVADIEGQAIRLNEEVNKFDNWPPGRIQKINRDALALEKEVNDLLADLVEKYGYHPLFRAGLREYCAT